MKESHGHEYLAVGEPCLICQELAAKDAEIAALREEVAGSKAAWIEAQKHWKSLYASHDAARAKVFEAKAKVFEARAEAAEDLNKKMRDGIEKLHAEGCGCLDMRRDPDCMTIYKLLALTPDASGGAR